MCVAPGTWLCPMMLVRVFGMPYLSHRYRVSAADDRYIASVYQEALSTYPSCSMPIDWVL